MKRIHEVRSFLYSQALADGLRSAFAILLPALIGLYTDHFAEGLTVALGAMCVSLTDAPGPLVHRRNGMLACTALAVAVALLTTLLNHSAYLLGAEIALITFSFSMFSVYGARATSVSNASILVLILTMDKPIPLEEVWMHGLLIGAGGLFYTVLSLLLYFLQPYRDAQRALGECVRSIAGYLSIRADFYDSETDLDAGYNRLLAQQVTVNERQDTVREIFFKTRQIVEESTQEGRRLVFAFVETVDLFEDITAAFYDYASLRQKFGASGALPAIHQSLKKIVGELDSMGMAIQGNAGFQRGFDYDAEIRQLKLVLDSTPLAEAGSRMVLRKILVNIRNLLQDLQNIQQYFEKKNRLRRSETDHSHFISHQSFDAAILFNNLRSQSAVFRHAVRVSAACLIGFALTKLVAYGQHSYWILLTIAFILKPAFSLTKQRNIERIYGTLLGALIGVLILLFVPNKTVQFALMVLFMIGTYTFMRIRYLVMVICTTPYVLILFSFLGTGFRDVARERILDTLIGCGIAFLASRLLFPQWESSQLRQFLQGIVGANARYLERVARALSGQPVTTLEYKLARKEVYLHSANLSAAFQRMLSEPKSKQSGASQLQQFVVLNHVLFSNTASLATLLLSRQAGAYPEELIALARKALYKLEEGNQALGGEALAVNIESGESTFAPPDEALLKEQLSFIARVSSDLQKLSVSLAG